VDVSIFGASHTLGAETVWSYGVALTLRDSSSRVVARCSVDSLVAIVSVEGESWTPSIRSRSPLHVGVDSVFTSLVLISH
jgi:hypothetical protein